jgi:peptide/nickel transport system substrate-binding protein
MPMKLLRSLTPVALAALLFTGCGDRKPAVASNTFYCNILDGLNTLDPARIGARSPWWIGGQIFSGLVGLDSSLQPIPLLARSWSVSDDGLTWTFNLRSDAYFSDDPSFAGGRGRRVVAEDLRYSFERICTPETGSTGFWVFRGKVKGAEEFYKGRESKSSGAPEHVAGFRAVNDTTFQIELVEPFAPFLTMLSIPYCYVVPREAVEKYGTEFARHPVGAGAFHLVEWLPDQELRIARNPNYFERDASGNRLPYLDTVRFSFIKNSKTEFIEFQQGKLDMISSIDPEFDDVVLAPDGKSLSSQFKDYGFYTTPAMSVEYYGFMLDSTTQGGKGSPFAGNRYLRRALNYAIDRESIIRYVLKGRAIAGTHGPIPPGTPGYSGIEGFRFDRDLARRLLDSAGYPNGRGLGTITLQLGQNERTASVAEAVQEQLKAIGVNINLVQVDFPQHREMILSGKLPFWRASWIGDYPDAENFIALFYSPYAAPRGPNTTRMADPGVDSLYRAALDPRLPMAQRAALYREAERIVLDEAPWVLLYYSVIQRLTQPGIEGYVVDPLDRLVLTRVRKKKG